MSLFYAIIIAQIWGRVNAFLIFVFSLSINIILKQYWILSFLLCFFIFKNYLYYILWHKKINPKVNIYNKKLHYIISKHLYLHRFKLFKKTFRHLEIFPYIWSCFYSFFYLKKQNLRPVLVLKTSQYCAEKSSYFCRFLLTLETVFFYRKYVFYQQLIPLKGNKKIFFSSFMPKSPHTSADFSS